MVSEAEAIEQWRKADAVCFDVDSTVCQDEAIDELAVYLGKGDEIKQLTATAMGGAMNFGQSLQTRMNILKVTRDTLTTFIKTHKTRLTPGIRLLVETLKAKGIPVFLVSGGFKEIINEVAKDLELPLENIYANRIIFDENGQYVDFDRTEPTSDSGSIDKGKPLVCGILKKRYGFKNLVMIGDGTTDLEASPPADLFIGFGGNQIRENVKKAAPLFITDFTVLTNELKKY